MFPNKKELLLTAIKNQDNYKHNFIFKQQSPKNNPLNIKKIQKIQLEKNKYNKSIKFNRI